MIERVTVVKFRVNCRGGNGAGCMRQIGCGVAVAAMRRQLDHLVYVYLYRMILRVIPCKSRCRLYNLACLHSFFGSLLHC